MTQEYPGPDYPGSEPVGSYGATPTSPPPFPQVPLAPAPYEAYATPPTVPVGVPYVAAVGVPYGLPMVAPYGVDPLTGLPYSDKSKVVAGLLQIFLGWLGVGRFYLGNIGMGIAQILVILFTFGLGFLWPLIDGIVLLAGSPRDRYGRPLRP